MAKQKVILVPSDEDDPLNVELVAEAILEVAKAFEKIQGSKLKQRAIVLLLHDIIPTSHNVGIRQIESILHYAPLLKKAFIK